MSPPDWTTGAAKWAAVGVLGVFSALGVYATLRDAGEQERTPVRAVSGPVERDASAASMQRGGAGDATEDGRASASPGPGVAIQIDVNSASAARLELLPGIGPTLAGRIVAEREANGPFGSIDDLQRVRGIGPKTVEKLRPLATVE